MNNLIYLFVGPSGSGKTTVANNLAEKHGWKIVESYTTRSPRFEGEKGHIFVTEEEFNALEDKCAYTFFDNHEYCATSKQIDESDIYIIDPAGIEYFKEHYKGKKAPYIFFFDTSRENAIERMRERGDSDGKILQRIINDKKEFSKVPLNPDCVIDSNSLTIDEIVGLIKRNHEVIGND